MKLSTRNGNSRKTKGKIKPDLIHDGLDTQAAIVATVERIWRDGRVRMYRQMRTWLTNVLFFRGEHWAEYHDGDDRYNWYTRDATPDYTRLTVNTLQKFVTGWVSRMTRNRPRHQTFPVTGDTDDKDRADVVNKLLDWQQEVIGFARQLQRVVKYAGLFGCGFLKAFHDDQAGAYIHPEAGMMDGDRELFNDDPALAQRFGFESGMASDMGGDGDFRFEDMTPKGRVCGKAVPPFEITIAGDWPRSLDEVRRLLHSRVVSLEELKERFYDHPEIDQLKPGTRGDEEHKLWFMRDAVRGLFRAGTDTDDEEDADEPIDSEHSIIVHELWGTATKLRPKGVFAVVAGGKLLWPEDPEELENPYYHGQLPFSMLEHTPDEVSFYPTCDLEQAVPIAHEYNIRISGLCDLAAKTSNPPLTAEKGHAVDFDNMTGAAGELWQPRKGFKVEYMDPPRWPTGVEKLLQELKFALEEIFGDHQPSKGVSQPGDSGVKVQALQAADEARFSSFAETLNSTLDRFWKQEICLLAQYADQEEQAHLLGERGERMFFTWSQDDLIGGYDQYDERAKIVLLHEGFDLRMTVVPAKSVLSIVNDLQFLLKTGVLNPEQHRAQVLEMLGYGFEVESLMEEERQHASQAAQEFDTFVKGEMEGEAMYPGQYEIHSIHLVEHRKASNTDRFRGLDPQQKKMWFFHMAEHERAMIREPLRQRYLAQAVLMEMTEQHGPLIVPPEAQGAPPGGGGGGGGGAPPKKPAAQGASGGGTPPKKPAGQSAPRPSQGGYTKRDSGLLVPS